MLKLVEPTLDRHIERLLSHTALTGEEQEAILSIPISVAKWGAGTTFVKAGDAITCACLVSDGLVSSVKQHRDGGRRIMALHIQGDIADAPSLALGEAVSGLEALSDASVLMIPLAGLQAAADAYPAIAAAYRRDAAVDASIQLEWAVNIGRKSARSRVAHLLCEMAARYERNGKSVGLSFELPMTQEDLSDAIAITAVHLNRTLAALRVEGIVEMRYRIVDILDWGALIKLANFDSHYLRFGRAVSH